MKSLYRPILTMLIPAFLVSCIESDNLSCVSTKLKLDIAESETKTPLTGTSFPDGASLGVFLDEGDGSYDGISYNNVRYHKEEGEEFMLESDILLSGTYGTLYAYYPYSENVTDPAHIPVDISKQEDYMYASPTPGLNARNTNAILNMNHALCCVRLVFSRGEYGGKGLVTQISISSDGLAWAGVLDASTGTFSSISGKGKAYTKDTSFTLPETGSITEDILMIPCGSAAPVNISCKIDGQILGSETEAVEISAGCMTSYEVTPGVIPVGLACVPGSILTIWTRNESIGLRGNIRFRATMSDGTTRLINPYYLEHQSSDESLATMDLTSICVGKGRNGTAVITSSYTWNGVTVSCDTEVRVNNISMTTVNPELDGVSSTTKVTLTDFNGAILDNPAITWSQSGSGSVYFYQGQPKTSQQAVAPKTKGPVTVRADYEGELGASYVTMDFNVISPVFSVIFTSPAKQDLESGRTLTLAPRAQGFMGSTVSTALGDFEWHSSDESIASVNDGVVTGVKAGTVEITCFYDGKRCTSPSTITVWEASYSHSIGYQSPAGINSLTMTSGETIQLDFWETKWCYLPDTGGTYPKYTKLTSEASWTSDDPTVASIDAGLVTAIKKGHVTITATYEGIKRYCTIYVNQ